MSGILAGLTRVRLLPGGQPGRCSQCPWLHLISTTLCSLRGPAATEFGPPPPILLNPFSVYFPKGERISGCCRRRSAKGVRSLFSFSGHFLVTFSDAFVTFFVTFLPDSFSLLRQVRGSGFTKFRFLSPFPMFPYENWQKITNFVNFWGVGGGGPKLAMNGVSRKCAWVKLSTEQRNHTILGSVLNSLKRSLRQ